MIKKENKIFRKMFIVAEYAALKDKHILKTSLEPHLKVRRISLRSTEDVDVTRGCSVTYPEYTLVLFDFILYVHSTIFQLCGTGLLGLNQY